MAENTDKPAAALGLEDDKATSEALNLPAEIDLITRQVGEARDLETVREIKDRAEALRVYCHKHDGLLEAHNRLAGVIARCERKIGQELRQAEQTGQRQRVGRPKKSSDAPTISDLGMTRDQAAEYQDMASVEEQVILDAIDLAGAEGREVTKKDIRRAVKEALGKAPPPAPKPEPDPELQADLEAASEAWEEGSAERELWWPVLKALKAAGELPSPAELFAAYHQPFDFTLRRAVPPALRWFNAFQEEWNGQERVRRCRQDGSAEGRPARGARPDHCQAADGADGEAHPDQRPRAVHG